MTDTVIDRETLTIAFERRLHASREEVFDAWTRPEQIAEWWDPTGARLAECRIDLRPGGAFHFANEGHSPPFTGKYVVIQPPSTLVFEALGSVGTVTIERTGDATRMRVTIRCASTEHFDHFVQLGVATNTDRTLDNLVAHLGVRAAQSHAP
jgi:uncharacterized protein YndB with AHSA1/START domain